jgi:predicted phage baseplate assembly protein
MLDQRSAQDLVDWAKAELIPRFCPQWTDHNVSDPGIALIEVFAAMVETLAYRVNRLPEQVETRLLELIGVHPLGPRQAEAPLTFQLSKPANTELTIAAGVEVATVRQPGEAEIVFTTREPLRLFPARLCAAQTQNKSQNEQGWRTHQLRAGQLVGEITIFPSEPGQHSRPDEGDAFYLGFEDDLSNHTLLLHLECVGGAPRGLDPTRPPIRWQAHAPQDGLEWVPCALEADTTLGFSQAGAVRLHLPAHMDRFSLGGLSARWLRCAIRGQSADSEYQASPRLQSIRAETWGGTVVGEHAAIVEAEPLGRSDGSPGQVFRLRQRPVLPPDPARGERLIVERDGVEELWTQVPDFGNSTPRDPHYTLDPIAGLVTLGPALLQPDGTLHCFGKVPPAGSRLSFGRYRYGGGLRGNVAAGELCVLKSARAYLAQVQNRAPATGGREAQSLADAALRAPALLRTRGRAVTANDFVEIAGSVPGVARAFCAAPGNQAAPAGPHQAPPPGKVRMAILPALDPNEIEERIATGQGLDPARIRLSAELRQRLLQTIKPLCPLGVSFELDSIGEPELVWATLELVVHLPGVAVARQRELEIQIRRALLRAINPYLGGADGSGWPFGRALRVFDAIAAAQPVLAGAMVERVRLYQVDPGRPGQPAAVERIALAPHGLVCLVGASVTLQAEV